MENQIVSNLALNRLFTRNTFSDFLNNRNLDFLEYIARSYTANNLTQSQNHRQLIADVYDFLRKEYRNEYFYKNTLLNKLLIGRHSLSTTTALAEIPIGKSKADFVIINGKGIVYEIKTELDKFDRLESQINDYYKAFNLVYVITCEASYKKLSQILNGTNTGICVLTKENRISVRKEAITDNSRLDYKTIFKLLRKNEFEEIISKYYGHLPTTSQFKYYNECYSCFQKIDLAKIYEEMLKLLKRRAHIEIKEFKEFVPYELRYLIYFSQYKLDDYKKLELFLNSEIGGESKCTYHTYEQDNLN